MERRSLQCNAAAHRPASAGSGCARNPMCSTVMSDTVRHAPNVLVETVLVAAPSRTHRTKMTRQHPVRTWRELPPNPPSHSPAVLNNSDHFNFGRAGQKRRSFSGGGGRDASRCNIKRVSFGRRSRRRHCRLSATVRSGWRVHQSGICL